MLQTFPALVGLAYVIVGLVICSVLIAAYRASGRHEGAGIVWGWLLVVVAWPLFVAAWAVTGWRDRL